MDEADTEIGNYIQDIQGLENFKDALEKKKTQTRKDVFVLFLEEVWKGSGYSENYGDPKESFFEEFGEIAQIRPSREKGVVGSEVSLEVGTQLDTLYRERTEEKIKARENAIDLYKRFQSDMEIHLDELEGIQNRLESARDETIDDWNKAESYWNQMKIIEDRVAEISEQRQDKGFAERKLLERTSSDINYPVLADLGNIILDVNDIRDQVISGMPYDLGY